MKLFVTVNIICAIAGFVIFAFQPINWIIHGKGTYLISFWGDGIIGIISSQIVFFIFPRLIRKKKRIG
jgi:hypothetical protein